MSRRRRSKLGRRSRGRLTAGFVLVIYLITSAGFIPMPVFASKKASGQPFPCQDHACGCATAEECWRHCCCFSAEERWSWAQEHGVQPPDYAERPAAKSWSTARLRDQGEQQEEPRAACAHCQPNPEHLACADDAASFRQSPAKAQENR